MSLATPHRIDLPAGGAARPAGPHLPTGSRQPVSTPAADAGNRRDGDLKDPNAPDKEGHAGEPAQFDSGSRWRADAESDNRAGLPESGLPESGLPESGLPESGLPDWLPIHAQELVDRLQAWASDLDAREAQLNARASLQEHRERQSRLRQQDRETELAEQQRLVDRMRANIEAEARREAFR